MMSWTGKRGKSIPGGPVRSYIYTTGSNDDRSKAHNVMQANVNYATIDLLYPNTLVVIACNSFVMNNCFEQ